MILHTSRPLCRRKAPVGVVKLAVAKSIRVVPKQRVTVVDVEGAVWTGTVRDVRLTRRSVGGRVRFVKSASVRFDPYTSIGLGAAIL